MNTGVEIINWGPGPVNAPSVAWMLLCGVGAAARTGDGDAQGPGQVCSQREALL